ncbi:hypothetical protein CYMTET_47859 [Cymbomonas tetramitiformis]|uniref:Uncharacterized protein n=1 Tax=Cymbomonas tetramitiformis TaxID=36881 RepID=A0AAE0EW75_9CHLO|nr:hypothetical protein CYMTET_47859 [Cymbomonas tetramitiformis]
MGVVVRSGGEAVEVGEVGRRREGGGGDGAVEAEAERWWRAEAVGREGGAEVVAVEVVAAEEGRGRGVMEGRRVGARQESGIGGLGWRGGLGGGGGGNQLCWVTTSDMSVTAEGE